MAAWESFWNMYRSSDAKTMKTMVQLRGSADRCAGITWCDVDVNRSRDIFTNEAEL